MRLRRFSPPLPLILVLLWSAVASAHTRDEVKAAVALSRAGERTAAVELYEAILNDDRSALAVPDDGLLHALIAVYETKAAGGDPALRFRLAWLSDIAGHVDRARELYAELAAGPTPEWADKARDNLETLDRERDTYERFLAELHARAEAESRSSEIQIAKRIAAEAKAEAVAAKRAASDAERAEDAGDVAELTRRIAAALDDLEALKLEAWRAKRDWYGREGARKWRAGPDEVPGSYDGTLRRRYRQAEAAVEAKSAEIDALKGALENYQ